MCTLYIICIILYMSGFSECVCVCVFNKNILRAIRERIATKTTIHAYPIACTSKYPYNKIFDVERTRTLITTAYERIII